ncbi:MAG TPA: hypothetical protein VKR58_08775 [Aquella sp.]|nr:hypothetical protein [Aquella sp.]
MYFIELFSVFLFFLIFGAIFSPFLGGCLVLLLMLFILGAFIVFFSLNFIWFIVAGLILYLIGFITKFYRWYHLPDYNEYINRHPQCKLDNAVSCFKCGSDKTIHNGLFNRQGKLRYYICATCGTTLFRFRVL